MRKEGQKGKGTGEVTLLPKGSEMVEHFTQLTLIVGVHGEGSEGFGVEGLPEEVSREGDENMVLVGKGFMLF